MVSTARLRSEYPELVVRQGSPPRCNFASARSVWFPAGGEIPGDRIALRFHPAAVDAARAMASVMLAHGYLFRERAGGTLSCRAITGGTLTTLHAHGIADDHNPSKNGYTNSVGWVQWGRQTDMSAEMIVGIEAIKTVGWAGVWQWGGRWWNIKDPMHFQLNVYRSQLARGVLWATVQGWYDYQLWERGSTVHPDVIPIDVTTWRPIVAKLQACLNAAAVKNGWVGFVPLTVDGKAGASTASAAARYRKDAGFLPAPSGIAFVGGDVAALLHLYDN